MKIKILMIISLVATNLTQLIAQEWILVGYDSQKNPYYIRSTSVNNDNGIIKIWTKSTYAKKIVNSKTKAVTYTKGEKKILYEFDCFQQKVLIDAVITYNTAGKVIDTYRRQEYMEEWSDVVPGSVGEMLLEKACEMFNE